MNSFVSHKSGRVDWVISIHCSGMVHEAIMHCILLLFCVSAVSGRLLLPVSTESDEEMIACVMDIIDTYVVRRTVIFYTEEESRSPLWVNMIRALRKPFTVVSQEWRHRDTEKLLVVLFPTPGTQYATLLSKLRKDTLFIVIGTKDFGREHLYNILSQFHKMKMTHEVVLIPVDGRINIYTSFPFSDTHCGETGPAMINTYVDRKFAKSNDLFATKKYWNLYQCTLTCIGNRQPPDSVLAMGKNGEIVFKRITNELLKILSEKLNFRVKIILPRNNNSSLQHSWFFYDDTIDVITEYLANEQVDFAIGLYSRLAFTNDSAITFGKETRFECYTWAVPERAGKTRSVFMNYLDEFSLNFWLLFTVCLVGAVIIIMVITQVLGENASLQSPPNALQYIFSTILNQPFPVKPKPWSLRIFVAHWLVYVLVITTAYQASLWSFMTIPWQVHNIHSLEDLLESSLEIGGAAQMLNILKSIHSSNENVQKMIDKFTVLPPTDFHDIIKRIETKRDFAVFGEKRHLSSHSKDFEKHFEKDKVYFVDGCLMQSLSTPLLFPNGSPLYEPINTMLIRLLQNGLMQKFGTLYGPQSATEGSTASSNDIPKEVGISIHRFRGVFFILLVGYAISSLVFACEIAFAKITRKEGKVKIILGPKLYSPEEFN